MLSVIGESRSQNKMLKTLRACYTMYVYVLESREYLQVNSTSLLHATKPTKEAIEIIIVYSA